MILCKIKIKPKSINYKEVMTQFVCKLWDRFRRALSGMTQKDVNFERSGSGGARTLDFVQSAIYNLGDRSGSKYNDILNYLCSQYGVDEKTIRGRVMTAIRRGVHIGVLEQDGNYYRLARCGERKRHRWRIRKMAQPQELCMNCHRMLKLPATQKVKTAKQDVQNNQEVRI